MQKKSVVASATSLKKGQTNNVQVEGKDDDDDDDDNNEYNCKQTTDPNNVRKSANKPSKQIIGDNNSSSSEYVEQKSKEINYMNRNLYISFDRMNELRRKVQEALKQHKTFTIRGCFFSIRQSLVSRGWVEKLDIHRKQVPSGICQVTYEDIAQCLPKRKIGESRRLYIMKCERNVMSRLLEHVPIDLLWTARKEKCDYVDQTKNTSMIINKIHRVPFNSKEGLCAQLKEFHWYYEHGTAELYFPRCYNAWSPEELTDFIENYKITSCISTLRFVFNKFTESGSDAVFSQNGYVPYTSLDFAIKRCNEFLENCQHKDIDNQDETTRNCEHDWDVFYSHHHLLANKNAKINMDQQHNVPSTIKCIGNILENLQANCPQFNVDGYLNLWIIKPANKCRGRGIHLLDSLRKILFIVNPATTSKSRYVVQKYIERPLIIHSTKFDIRQWFLITSVSPLIVWMYKESYLRFSTQEYNLSNYHESIHLTNHAIQKKYRCNGMRDKRLPVDNMWDCYSFQAYLRQIGKQDMWISRIYPGMKKAITGAVLASQENMDRRPNNFELFGADFMICEDFYPWLLEINSSPDLGSTTSVTARMCPQCLEDVIKVVIDRRIDPKADTGSFELIYRQSIPQTPAYMGLNLYLKGKQILTKRDIQSFRKERNSLPKSISLNNATLTTTINSGGSNPNLQAMPTFNATELLEKVSSNNSQLLAKRNRQLILKKQSISSTNIGPSNGYSSRYKNILQKDPQRNLVVPVLVSNTPNIPQTQIHRRLSNDLLWQNRLLDQSVILNRYVSCTPRISMETTEKFLKSTNDATPTDGENCLTDKNKSFLKFAKITTDSNKSKPKNSQAKENVCLKHKQQKKCTAQQNSKKKIPSAKNVCHRCVLHTSDNNNEQIGDGKGNKNNPHEFSHSYNFTVGKSKDGNYQNRAVSCGPRLPSSNFMDNSSSLLNHSAKLLSTCDSQNMFNSQYIESNVRSANGKQKPRKPIEKSTKLLDMSPKHTDCKKESPLLVKTANSKKNPKLVKKEKSNWKRSLSSSKSLKKSRSSLLIKPIGNLFRKTNTNANKASNNNLTDSTTSFHAVGKSLKMNKNKENKIIWKRQIEEPPISAPTPDIAIDDFIIKMSKTNNKPLHRLSNRSHIVQIQDV